jgi:MoaA/NifB/PqqE/SkfB family radical SAM enzyme
MNKKRLNIHMYVTPICNLECIHCYYEAKDTKFKIGNQLSIKDMKYIIETLVDNYDAYFDIEGGELFLREDIDNLFNSLDKKYLKRLTLTTNGTVNFNLNQDYLKYLDELRISFEGSNNSIQKRIRGIELNKPLNLAKRLLKNGVMPTIRITIHKENFNKISNIIDFYSSYGFRRFGFYEFIDVGRGKNYSDLTLKEDDFYILAKIIENLDKKVYYKFSFPKQRAKFFKNYLAISRVSSLTINYNGDIGICPWNIGKDIFTKFNKKSFLSDIKSKNLIHTCNYCSSIRITNA